jgi:hypothetical protein
MSEAERESTNWVAKQGAAPLPNRRFQGTSHGDAILVTHVKYERPQFELTTVFIEASWL